MTKAPQSEQGEGAAAFVAAVISSPSSPARCWGCVCAGLSFTSLACATTIIPLKYKTGAAAAETEAIQREGNRAALISVKYL